MCASDANCKFVQTLFPAANLTQPTRSWSGPWLCVERRGDAAELGCSHPCPGGNLHGRFSSSTNYYEVTRTTNYSVIEQFMHLIASVKHARAERFDFRLTASGLVSTTWHPKRTSAGGVDLATANLNLRRKAATTFNPFWLSSLSQEGKFWFLFCIISHHQLSPHCTPQPCAVAATHSLVKNLTKLTKPVRAVVTIPAMALSRIQGHNIYVGG